jgi:thiamine kinase
LQPESAINSWQHWSGGLRTRPIILGPLSGGRSNRSFLLESDDKKMVLRLNGEDSFLPDGNRSSEVDIWESASEQGIAPRLLHVDRRNRFLVSVYIINKLPPQPPFSAIFVDRAFELLDRCHRLDVDTLSINYVNHVENYWRIIEKKNHPVNPSLTKQREPMRLQLDELINSGSQTGLCHHDPVIANFVGDQDRLYLIDWEYAARGLVVMDYAALGVEWGIDDTVIINRTGFEAETLSKAKKLYKYLSQLWEEATS